MLCYDKRGLICNYSQVVTDIEGNHVYEGPVKPITSKQLVLTGLPPGTNVTVEVGCICTVYSYMENLTMYIDTTGRDCFNMLISAYRLVHRICTLN